MAVDWFSPSTFDWGEAPPLSSFEAVATASLLYVVGVVLTTALSRALIPAKQSKAGSQSAGRGDAPEKTTDLQWQPWFNSDLKQVQFVHNVNLVGSSALMLGGVILESIRRIQAEGGMLWPPFLLCEVADGQPASGSLYYWSYIYYLSKYYELLDTVLQLARGKPPPHFVLHVYHHAAVLFMAWAWVEYKQSLHFIGLAWNTAVHVVMYTYFLQRTITRKVPRWKSFVTLFQIIQFAFSMVATIVTLFIVFVQKHDCSGMNALFGNVLFNVTLLYSFIQVFLQGKKKKVDAKKKK
mmetsp:Transcript_15011/g.25028  ORF Transcript_15011/g.25028 Transcript_15011/m.25028 type:complete len:295 (-) Transcript_15011:1051-1935(-)|eukprot:CAMPEP_0197726758 /NCGR_PEP_ID=MMETSP1434-20131217/17057_1 /TAXON_ID=265543 /ORGANISM="Minutocellus polymorphus, Strain CCMP3303" /LENGTH=294 /DNA_ID=CAMNT_0043312781 /DNA_START=43 /DNA_END=927 /DNA_ORIENTATION=+